MFSMTNTNPAPRNNSQRFIDDQFLPQIRVLPMPQIFRLARSIPKGKPGETPKRKMTPASLATGINVGSCKQTHVLFGLISELFSQLPRGVLLLPYQAPDHLYFLLFGLYTVNRVRLVMKLRRYLSLLRLSTRPCQWSLKYIQNI